MKLLQLDSLKKCFLKYVFQVTASSSQDTAWWEQATLWDQGSAQWHIRCSLSSGCSWQLQVGGLFFYLLRKTRILLLCLATWSDYVLFFSWPQCVFCIFFNRPREGRQGTSVVSCNRMVPAGVSHVSPQRLLSDPVRACLPLSFWALGCCKA